MLNVFLFCCGSLLAHPGHLCPVVVEFDSAGQFVMTCRFDVIAAVVRAPPGNLSDELVEELATLPREKLLERIATAQLAFERRLFLQFDGRTIAPTAVEFPTPEKLREGDLTNAGRTQRTVVVRGACPASAKTFSIVLPSELEQVLLTVVRPDGSTDSQGILAGDTSLPVELRPTASWLSGFRLAARWVWLGFEHILPLGLDHILFVLGLFLLSTELRPLLWQVTTFTVAHSVTLALSSLKIFSLPSQVVEPLIALSIVVVALENVWTSQLHRWRIGVVFGFGLLHGLGFAGVLAEQGLPEWAFLTGLIGFNVGVELGQLSVIALAWLLLGAFQTAPWYRRRVVVPASWLIAGVGVYWTIERCLG